MSTKLNPGPADCYANALPDEPMFVLLARDPAAPDVVRSWAMRREMMVKRGEKPESDSGLVWRATTLATEMEAWRKSNWPARKGEKVATYDLEEHLWSIIDREGLADVPSDIVAAVSILVGRSKKLDAILKAKSESEAA